MGALKTDDKEAQHAFTKSELFVPTDAMTTASRSAFFKARSLIHCFKKKRQWKSGLNQHCISAGIKPLKLNLDMPVRWNSTAYMRKGFLKLETPIRSLYVV